ncbi:hypothetical protein GP486_008544 [Trichoglossum hirsutum]|uniref:Uncharacterized protein n=1 Tax=Trichoglossum hirsutum TaxID=265104 RepID=A0A9P8KZT2_9PEZI|nr:hypothetical protein GP486_008544 [Trichoglossum hirsutum]
MTYTAARKNAKPVVPDALKKAIESLGAELLRKELNFLCQHHRNVIYTLEDRLLVRGKDVVRYHIDSDSEDRESSEGSESGSSAAGEIDPNRESDRREPIAIGDEEYTARIATCENCNQEFDVTSNERGVKAVDLDSDFWADHDVDCHGPFDAFEDDPGYAEGFVWDCCEEPGDNEGCKATKHKSESNLVVPAPPPAAAAAAPVPAPSKKRSVEEEAPGTSSKRGRRMSPN